VGALSEHPFPRADCLNCWKVKICDVVGQNSICPFFEPVAAEQVDTKGAAK